MEPPPEMMKKADKIQTLLYQIVPPGVMFTFQLATEGEKGWVILRGNLSDEGIREAMKEMASRL
jgi:hypothetical protein